VSGCRLSVLALAACLASALLTAANVSAAPGDAGPQLASLLWYEESEPGTDSYPVRIIVTAGHVRIDDDDDNGDFVLLDRITRSLYSVSRGEQSILVIEYRAQEQRMPDDLRLDVVIEEHDTVPTVAGRQPQLISLMANGATCYRVAAVSGLLEDAVAGLADYARVLGNRQLGSLQSVPAELQTPCFLSRYVYAPDRHLRHGLPVLEWDGQGYRRSLVKYRSGEQVDPGLFVLPGDYRRLRLEPAGS